VVEAPGTNPIRSLRCNNVCRTELMQDLSHIRVTVMGLGRFGGGIGAVRYFLDRGARVTVTDLADASHLQSSLDAIDRGKLEHLVLGEHRLEDFQQADLIVVNPAVRPHGNRFLQAAREAGVPLTSEAALFWERCRARKLAVTGTVGKSTTASLIHHLLCTASVPARLGGNIGISLLPEVDSIASEEWVVLELSSFQLADLARLKPRPDVAVVTNFHPNHLDWHGSVDEYRQAKQTLLRWQTKRNLAVLNADDPDVRQWPTRAGKIWFRTGESPSDDELELAPALRFPHQRGNVAAAVSAVFAGAGIPFDSCREGLRTFPGLPHRLEVIGTYGGRTFINDSKATTPDATLAALNAFTGSLVLIAGGKDKGTDLSPLAEAIARRVRAVVLIGETAPTLAQRIRSLNENLPLTQAVSLKAAVEAALDHSAPGTKILLSPGCASFGEFANYEERGATFTRLVRAVLSD
jgi:UDP-N-acetylmuramoylalanine--D-glutamate ligase